MSVREYREMIELDSPKNCPKPLLSHNHRAKPSSHPLFITDSPKTRSVRKCRLEAVLQSAALLLSPPTGGSSPQVLHSSAVS